MKNLKPEFSINEVGKFRFYSGILIGIGFSIILNSLFRLTLRVCNLGMSIDQWSLEYEIPLYYHILIGFASFGFSFCFTTYLWMSKPFANNRRKTLKLRMAQINPIWIFFGTLIFLLRLFWFFTSIELTIEKDFPVLGFMIPTFIYLYCWNLISDIYKSKKAFLISSLIFIISGIILSGI
ncbi:hypothetical protein [Polaribacter sp. Hel_I_88]|uniref:hypothetical protein n=1 Tax=Polaribacter sp. Hel_I_88 TaxID=1250006 RepID=UPI00047A8CB7|nr:hypothetical protein [Polaribacter sp. Hel_I_88]